MRPGLFWAAVLDTVAFVLFVITARVVLLKRQLVADESETS